MYYSNLVSVLLSRSACNVLPSFLKRKLKTGESTCKRPKTLQCWDRDIVCLPQTFATKSPIPFPRGKSRDNLSRLDLIGKVRLLSSMSVQDVQDEVRSTFSKAMGDRKDFPFIFLEPTGAGCRSLTTPSTSLSFSWTAQQVAKLGSNKQSIYILAMDKLSQELEVSPLIISILFWIKVLGDTRGRAG